MHRVGVRYGLSFGLVCGDIHVIGDAAIAAPMPKSAFAANAQAKVCAIALVRLFRGLLPESRCWRTPVILSGTGSMISMSVSYLNDQFLIAAAAGASPCPPAGLHQRRTRRIGLTMLRTFS